MLYPRRQYSSGFNFDQSEKLDVGKIDNPKPKQSIALNCEVREKTNLRRSIKWRRIKITRKEEVD
jgi:hypothetical protein